MRTLRQPRRNKLRLWGAASDENFHYWFHQEIGRDILYANQKHWSQTARGRAADNVSQLAGFAKKDDLRYFTHEICHIDYVHVPALAPTADILDPYKKQKNGDWQLYERQFLDLMTKRRIEETVSREVLDGGCLLCSEEKPHHCHRRLVAEHLKENWGDVEIEHIP